MTARPAIPEPRTNVSVACRGSVVIVVAAWQKAPAAAEADTQRDHSHGSLASLEALLAEAEDVASSVGHPAPGRRTQEHCFARHDTDMSQVCNAASDMQCFLFLLPAMEMGSTTKPLDR